MSIFSAMAALNLLAITACSSIIDMDKPLAPVELMWRSPGKSTEDVDAALRLCSTKNDPRYADATMRERLDAQSICMLKKRFVFVRKPKDYPDICSYRIFDDSVACRSSRGEYTVGLDDGLRK